VIFGLVLTPPTEELLRRLLLIAEKVYLLVKHPQSLATALKTLRILGLTPINSTTTYGKQSLERMASLSTTAPSNTRRSWILQPLHIGTTILPTVSL